MKMRKKERINNKGKEYEKLSEVIFKENKTVF